VVRYADNNAFNAIVKQLVPILGDLKVGCRAWDAGVGESWPGFKPGGLSYRRYQAVLPQVAPCCAL
jgi:hypothetical protein